MKNNYSGNSYLDKLKSDTIDRGITKATTQTDKKDPNVYALIALVLGILGLILSFINAKAAIGGAMVTGIASAGSLIGMMLDLKKKARLDLPDLNNRMGENDFSNKLNNMADNMNISLDFTPWFYIAVLAFLAAAFLAYKRMSTMK